METPNDQCCRPPRPQQPRPVHPRLCSTRGGLSGPAAGAAALGSAPSSVRRRFAELTRQAKAACTECPLLADCLYRAVVVYDVAGFVAGTTERQRSEIRRRLGIRIAPEDFDTLAGVSGGHRPVDHGEVVRSAGPIPRRASDEVHRSIVARFDGVAAPAP